MTLATAFVSIRPDTVGFGSRLSKSVNTESDKAGKAAGGRLKSGMARGLAGLGGILAGAFAVEKGVTFFKDAIGEATEARKVGAQTAAVLKSTGNAAGVSAKQLGDLATAISNKTGIDDEAIQSGANLLLTFKNIRNESGKGNDIFNQTTSIMTDMAAAMGKEPRSAAIQLGKALNDPIKGVSALSRVGVTFDDSQKATIKRMVETGNTMGAQRLILRELNSEFRGSAEAQATPAEKARVAWGNFQEQIGTAILPLIDRLATFLSERVVPAMAGFVQGIQDGTGAGGRFRDVVAGIADAVGAAGGFIADHRKAFVGLGVAIATVTTITRIHSAVMAVQAAGGMLQYLKATRLVAAATRAYTAVQWALNLAMTANPIGLVVVAVAALVAAFVIAYKRSDKFREIVDGAMNGVKDAAQAVVRWFTRSFVPFFTDTIPGAFRATKRWVTRNWPTILGVITGPIGLATLFITRHWDTITDAFRDAKDWVVGRFRRAWSGVQGVVLTPVRAARDAIRDIFGGNGPVRTAFTNVKNWATGVFKRSWDNVQGVIMTPLRAARDAIQRLFGRGGPIRNAFSNAVEGIGRIWAGLRNAAMAPVRFVVNTVYNKGIQEILSRIPGVPHPRDIQGFAAGGWTGPGGRDRPAGIVHADEHVWTKEEANRFPGGHRGLERLRTRARMGLIREGEFADVPGYATGGRVRMDGKWLSVIAARQIRLMERMAKVNFRVMQGGYGGSHIAASGTSHNYPGVADFSPASIQYERLARRVGFAAWARNIPGRSSVGSGAHIHAVSLLDPGDARSAQVYGSWRNHGNGLSGANNDPAPHVPWLPNLRALLGNIPIANLGGGGGGGGYAGPSVGDVVSALNPATWVRKLRGIGGWGNMLGGMVRNVAGAAKRVLVGKVRAAIRTVGRALTGGAGPTSGPVSQAVRRVANTYGWGQGDEWNALSNIISKESGWNLHAANPNSSARGLFQKMTSLHGPIERTAEGQAVWGLNYIKDRYGDPIGAWQHWQRNRSYDTGAIANGAGWIYKGPGKERVLSERQTETYDKLLPILERIDRGNTGGSGPVRIVLDAGGGVTLTGHIDNRIQGRQAQAATVRRQRR